MNGLVTIGIPASEIIQFITSGLSATTPPSPTDPFVGVGSLSLGEPKAIASNVEAPYTSTIYALPPGTTRITWQSTIGGTMALQGSLDSTHMVQLDTMSTAGVQSIQTNAKFIRVNITAGSGVTVIVTAKREMM